LHKIAQLDLRAAQIYTSIIEFHKIRKLEIPPSFRINNLIHNICYKLSDNYRDAIKEHTCQGYDQKLLGHFDHAGF